jgi:hypothetical protein
MREHILTEWIHGLLKVNMQWNAQIKKITTQKV